MEIDSIEEGFFYHIFNRGNNGGDIFFEDENYRYFLKLLDRYVLPVADLYAYCLMRNHFHFLVRIKESNEIKEHELKYTTVKKPKLIDASRQFSHFFNAYSQAVNKKYGRTGSLFEKPFERRRINDEDYLKNAIIYIHRNPINHGICSTLEDYKWCSYNEVVNGRFSKIKKEEVFKIFEDIHNFKFCHENSNNSDWKF